MSAQEVREAVAVAALMAAAAAGIAGAAVWVLTLAARYSASLPL